MTGGLFTWSNNQEIPILEKRDRVLASKDWEDCFPSTFMKKNYPGMSLIITLLFYQWGLVIPPKVFNSDLREAG
jgi:hypothetical protein